MTDGAERQRISDDAGGTARLAWVWVARAELGRSRWAEMRRDAG
jgi:hypothetical protein